ncbi:hypothetical protein RsTz2092_05710 [Deferribacterales bacterium RsTz2092]|nr:hypothetical protein AGMMS49941_05830 [Deferribacterales bacterium]
MSFEQLFKEISPEAISDNVFTLTGKDLYAITAGKQEHYNSMVGSGGGFGLIFRKPATWCFIREDRYTLELIQKEQTYTLSYFPQKYKEKMLFLGSKTGRDSDKMREVELTSIQTPSSDMSFREAKLVIECSLTALIPGLPDYFCKQETKNYINEAYREEKAYRKIVFGDITHVWAKK